MYQIFCSLLVSRHEYWPCQVTYSVSWKTSCCCRCLLVTSHAMGSSQGVIQTILIIFTCHKYIALVNIEPPSLVTSTFPVILLSWKDFFYFFPFSFLNKGHELPMGLWERELSRTEISWKREQISSLKETEIISPGKDFSGSFFPCWKQTTFTECLLPLDVSAGQKKGKSSETTYSRVLGYGYHSSSQNNAPGLLFAKGMNNNWHSWECFIGQLHTQMCGDPNLWSTLL